MSVSFLKVGGFGTTIPPSVVEEDTWEEPKKGKGRGKGNQSWKNDWTQELRGPTFALVKAYD